MTDFPTKVHFNIDCEFTVKTQEQMDELMDALTDSEITLAARVAAVDVIRDRVQLPTIATYLDEKPFP